MGEKVGFLIICKALLPLAVKFDQSADEEEKGWIGWKSLNGGMLRAPTMLIMCLEIFV